MASYPQCITDISIHALLAESDHYDNYNLHCVEISIHALLAESDYDTYAKVLRVNISIHALLAESDIGPLIFSVQPRNFNPRSPCGERRRRGVSCYLDNIISIHALLAESDPARSFHSPGPEYFYPRSPCGERRPTAQLAVLPPKFLSTLSLRRATLFGHNVIRAFVNFYPRSPCGERPYRY